MFNLVDWYYQFGRYHLVDWAPGRVSSNERTEIEFNQVIASNSKMNTKMTMNKFKTKRFS